jgi:hypothetical protein
LKGFEMRILTREEKMALEMMIDASGISEILETLSVLCAEKANHVISSYNDEILAAVWASTSRKLRFVSNVPSIRALGVVTW